MHRDIAPLDQNFLNLQCHGGINFTHDRCFGS